MLSLIKGDSKFITLCMILEVRSKMCRQTNYRSSHAKILHRHITMVPSMQICTSANCCPKHQVMLQRSEKLSAQNRYNLIPYKTILASSFKRCTPRHTLRVI
ncbi:hypothetical protein KC19_VG241200 [Ceratodon purpureus]|uniref:Uncharacterized protein n=1 Tax=Ceratodon purpureus TaxID=3225 RepID=A0A8T0HT20_CERPU|nr:hypothetical protein KC19_VG241200 [Ceratodon purpureus]